MNQVLSVAEYTLHHLGETYCNKALCIHFVQQVTRYMTSRTPSLATMGFVG